MKFLRNLRRQQRGAVTIEFALWATLIFIVLLTALDIGRFSIQRGQVAEAVSAASLAAFKQRSSVNYNAIPGYIRAASAVPNSDNMVVSVGCNGSANNCANSDRTCACLSQAGRFVPANSCSQSCGAGRAGYYLNITATYPYQPLFLPKGMLGDTSISQRTTVRLQ